jgi:hypothetical protein
MVYFFTGLLLTGLKLLPIYCFQDLKRGIMLILGLIFFLHTFTGILTQSLGVFSYPVVLSIHLFYGLCVLVVCKKFSVFLRVRESLQNLPYKKMIFPLLCFGLGSVFFLKTHYSYTGEVRTIHGMASVINDFYPYPLYSDEWVGSLFVKRIIETGSLPLFNAFYPDVEFLNFLLFFQSFTSHEMMLFGLDPIIHYSLLSVLLALGVMLVSFFLIKSWGVSLFSSSLVMIFVPVVLNTTHTPGLLFYLPFLLSFFFLLLSLLSESHQETKAFILFLALSFIVYPAILVLIILLPLILFRQSIRSKLNYFYLLGFSLFLPIILLVLQGYSFQNVFSKILENVIHPKVTHFHEFLFPWTMISIPLFFLALLGVYASFKKKLELYLFLIFLGFFLWGVEHFTTTFFFLEHVRVITITSYLLILASTLGVDYLIDRVRIKESRVVLSSFFIFLASFSLVSAFDLSRLEKLKVILKWQNDVVTSPKNHINRYLHEDDLRLFQGLSGKRFLAHPWKSLILAAVTGNYPLDTKHSTLSIFLYDYHKFLKLPCHKRKAVMEKYKIDYVYVPTRNCRGFNLLGTSAENLSLYEYAK